MSGVRLPYGVLRDALWPLLSSTEMLWSEEVFLDPPVEGWRAWGVDTSGTLRSITYPHVWGDGSNAASCASSTYGERVFMKKTNAVQILGLKRQRGEAVDARLPDPVLVPYGHAAPHIDCGCGFWLFKDEGTLRAGRRKMHDWWRNKHVSGWLVTGRVSAWGSAVEHEFGWRAEHATAVGDLVIHGLHHAPNRERLLPFLAEKIREKNRVGVFWEDSFGNRSSIR